MPVVLYSAATTPEKLDDERIECASNAAFKILSQANEAGIIAASVCPEHVARLRMLAVASAQGLDMMLALLQAEAMRLCGFDAPDPSANPNPSPLCTDPKGTLNAIAQRLLR